MAKPPGRFLAALGVLGDGFRAKPHRPRGRLSFALMSLLFHVRDLLWPPSVVLRQVGVLSGQTVLDFGCGPGGYSIAAARLVGPAGRVYALDVNPLAAKAVQRAAQKNHLANVVPVVGDSPASLQDHGVDIAILHDVLHELADPAKVALGFHRVLKKDGTLWIGDHHMKKAAIVSAISAGGLFELFQSLRRLYGFKPVKRN